MNNTLAKAGGISSAAESRIAGGVWLTGTPATAAASASDCPPFIAVSSLLAFTSAA